MLKDIKIEDFSPVMKKYRLIIKKLIELGYSYDS